MKKILCLLITITLLFTSISSVFAKSNGGVKNNGKQVMQKVKQQEKVKKQTFKINGLPVIKYGRYKLPLAPVTKGMGATVTFDRDTAILTVVKDTNTIIINFKEKTVTVNGVADTTSGIFSAKSNNGMTVLIKYIAKALGIRANVDDDEITVEVPGLNRPTDIILTPSGTNIKPNTLNSTSIFLSATANITANQATGGKAELYVGSRLVATDTTISATDTQVSFTTSDGTPTNAELQAAIPEGGIVSVKLYNAAGLFVTSNTVSLRLIVDYVMPTLAGITSAVYNAEGNSLYLNVTGASAVKDIVDVTKLTFYDASLGRYYTLTNTANIGSKGIINSAGSLLVTVGSLDKANLAGFGGTDVTLRVAAGALLSDEAGNTLNIITEIQNIPVTVLNNGDATGLNAPTNITVTAAGGTVKPNTLNSTNLYMIAIANITAGQATGGKAELYIGSKLVATDSVINAADTAVNFTTSDETPTNAELQAAVPAGGIATVKLYNAAGVNVTSGAGNPTITADYVSPTLISVNSAVYFAADKKLYITVTGASVVGDDVDVTKLSLYDASLGRSYALTSGSTAGSNGAVAGPNLLVVNIGSTDRTILEGYDGTDVTMVIAVGSLLTDDAGNSSGATTTIQTVPVSIIK